MRVEITEPVLRDAGYNLAAGDIITVPDELGATWCGHGWAKDTAGVVPTGERIVTGAHLKVDKITSQATATNVGG